MSSDDDLISLPKRRKVLEDKQFYINQFPKQDVCIQTSYKPDIFTAYANQLLFVHNGTLEIREMSADTPLIRSFPNLHSSAVKYLLTGENYATSVDSDYAAIIDLATSDITLKHKVKVAPIAAIFYGDKLLLFGESQLQVDGEDPQDYKIEKLKSLKGVAYNAAYNCLVAWDCSGNIAYWKPNNDSLEIDGLFETKLDTDLYHYRKSKVPITSISVASSKFAVVTANDVTIFDFLKGKKLKVYSEAGVTHASFDSSEQFLIHDSDQGTKLVNIKESIVERVYKCSAPVITKPDNYTLIGISDSLCIWPAPAVTS